jgi:hypothetical protein
VRLPMSLDTFSSEIRKANDLMARGDKQEAKRVLDRLFETSPEKKGLYGDAVNIYLAGKMFDEAKAVFARYKSRFGEDLRSDVELSDIEREQNEYAARRSDSAPIRTFRRMSAFQRGRLSNLPMIFPVKEIKVSQEEIVLRKCMKEYHYAWPDIQDAFITSRDGYKGYLFSEDVIKTLNLRTKDRTFRIDVSANFPDFTDTDLLLEELRKRIVLREEKERKRA